MMTKPAVNPDAHAHDAMVAHALEVANSVRHQLATTLPPAEAERCLWLLWRGLRAQVNTIQTTVETLKREQPQ